MILKNVSEKKRKKNRPKRQLKPSLLLNGQFQGPLKNKQGQLSFKLGLLLQLGMLGINFIKFHNNVMS